jgi:hypothetical protein
MAFLSSIEWVGGVAPTITSATGKVDIFKIYSPNSTTTNLYGSIVGQNFAV